MFPDQFNPQPFYGLSGLSLLGYNSPMTNPVGSLDTYSTGSPTTMRPTIPKAGIQAAISGSETTPGVVGNTPPDNNEQPDVTPTGPFAKIGGLEGLAQITKGIGSIGQIYAALQGLKLAKEQFAFSKDAYNANMANQTKSYNTALTDRANARAVMQNQDQASAQAYIDQNRL